MFLLRGFLLAAVAHSQSTCRKCTGMISKTVKEFTNVNPSTSNTAACFESASDTVTCPTGCYSVFFALRSKISIKTKKMVAFNNLHVEYF